ncbi:transposable element Tcb2 transposase [Trichonephila clavipes]|nr:transposable element Tcb2 transposase [Trichonephila clavipes]
MARRNHLDDLTCERIIEKLEKGRSLTSVAEEFGINKSIVSRSLRAFQTIGTAARKVAVGQHRKTSAVDARYIILQAIRARYQSVRAIIQPLCAVTGSQVPRFTVARCLHKGSLFARRSEPCILLKVGYRWHRLEMC